MKNRNLSLIFALLIASTAFGDVTVCNLKKVVKNPDGTQTTTSCRVSIDSSDHSGDQGSGGISHDRSLGTLSTNCTGLPADYEGDGNLRPFQMYDQGSTPADDVAGLTQMITEMGYLQNGNLGFDTSKISSLEWAAGGFDLLTYLYTAYDSNGKKLGVIFYGGMSPRQSFQGCYVN